MRTEQQGKPQKDQIVNIPKREYDAWQQIKKQIGEAMMWASPSDIEETLWLMFSFSLSSPDFTVLTTDDRTTMASAYKRIPALFASFEDAFRENGLSVMEVLK
jgi:hypothetical protein